MNDLGEISAKNSLKTKRPSAPKTFFFGSSAILELKIRRFQPLPHERLGFIDELYIYVLTG